MGFEFHDFNDKCRYTPWDNATYIRHGKSSIINPIPGGGEEFMKWGVVPLFNPDENALGALL